MPLKICENLYCSRSKYYDSNTYIFINDENKILLVDPGSGDFTNYPESALWELGLRAADVKLIIATHAHYNHYAAARKFSARLAAHKLDAEYINKGSEETLYRLFSGKPAALKVELELEHGQVLQFGEFELQVLHTPGHTPGSICLLERRKGLLLTGDTLLGKALLPRLLSSPKDYAASLRMLLQLSPRLLLPGHGELLEYSEACRLLRQRLEIYNCLHILEAWQEY
ncbi:MAG: MBL fold metallo-hydrolase [bacterium]|nr:MBL fold metallo-hydrolase [bacterium]